MSKANILMMISSIMLVGVVLAIMGQFATLIFDIQKTGSGVVPKIENKVITVTPTAQKVRLNDHTVIDATTPEIRQAIERLKKLEEFRDKVNSMD